MLLALEVFQTSPPEFGLPLLKSFSSMDFLFCQQRATFWVACWKLARMSAATLAGRVLV